MDDCVHRDVHTARAATMGEPKQMPEAMNNDPIESIIYDALIMSNVQFLTERDIPEGLDFYLPEYDTYIECKRMHSDRIAKQTSRVENIIVIQGIEAAQFFVKILDRHHELNTTL